MSNTLRRARKNFHIVPNDIYDMPPTLTTYAIVVYTCLQRYAGNDDTAFPSFETLMEKCRIKSDKTLTKAINCLIDHGLLKKEIRYCKEGFNKGRRTSNLYTLYDPPEIIKPVNNTGNDDELTVNNTVRTTVNNTVVLTVPDTVEQDTIKEQYTFKNKTQLNSTPPAVNTVKLSQVKSSSTSTSNKKKKQNHSDKEKKEIKPRTEIETEIKSQIDYDYLKQDFSDEPILDEIFNLIVDCMRSEKSFWIIGGEKIPTEEVKKKYKELDMNDISAVVKQMQTNTKEIKNPKAYIVATLFKLKDGQHTQFQSMYNADIINRRN